MHVDKRFISLHPRYCLVNKRRSIHCRWVDGHIGVVSHSFINGHSIAQSSAANPLYIVPADTVKVERYHISEIVIDILEKNIKKFDDEKLREIFFKFLSRSLGGVNGLL